MDRATRGRAAGYIAILAISVWVYVFATDIDPVSGLPIYRHPRGLVTDANGNVVHDERCGVTVDCVVGWTISAKPGQVKFLYHNGVNGDDHPVWLANRTDEVTSEGLVSGIPQPGSNTHFHWISQGSTDPRAVSVTAECDKNDAAQLQDQAPSAVNRICKGWFLQLVAVKNFTFDHGGEKIPVHFGLDNATHLNLVTNYEASTSPTITPTR